VVAAVSPVKHPRIFYGWYIVGACIALNFYLSVVFFQGFQVFFIPILTEFAWSRALTSGAYSLRQLESGLLAPVLGFLVDRWGPRNVILASVVLSGAGLVLLAFINSVWTFYLALLVVSIGTSGASHGVSWPVVVSSWFSRLRGRALGLAMLGPVVAGPFIFLVAIMEQNLGWRHALLLLGIGTWIVGIPLAMVARTEPKRYGLQVDGDTAATKDKVFTNTGAGVSDEATSGLTAIQAMRTRDFWALSFLLGLQFLGTSGVTVHLIPLLEDIKYSATFAATVLGIVFLLSGIGRIGAGIVADVVGYRAVMIGLLVSQIVALAILPTLDASQYVKLWVFALLFGAGFGGMVPLRPYLARQLFGPRAFGSIQGLVQGVAVATGVLGPILYGWIFDLTESYDMAIYSSIAVLVIAIPLVLVLSVPRGKNAVSA